MSQAREPAGPTEEKDLSLRRVALVAALAAGGLLAGAAAMRGLHHAFIKPGAPPRKDRPAAPSPRLQSDPAAELAALRRREDAVLTSYGWVDRKAGVVRIPIERAMTLLSVRGPDGRRERSSP